MAIEMNRTALKASREAFWRKEVKMFPAGFAPVEELAVGTVVERGALVSVNVDNLTASVVAVGKVVKGGTTSAPRVAKRNNFKVGDTVMVLGTTTGSQTIKAIDKSNVGYDVVTFNGALTGATENAYLTKAVAEGSGVKPANVPNAVLGQDLIVKEVGIPTIDASYDAIVLKSVVDCPAEWLIEGGFALKTNPNILFINQ